MMKYLGCTFIICGCMALSYYYETKEKAKLRHLTYMMDFIRYMENKISFFLTPKHILFEEYENCFIKELINSDFKELSAYYDAESASLLKDFFDNLGKGLKDEQLNQCRYTEEKLSEALKRAEGEFKNKTKVFRAIVLFFGATLSILII